MSKTPLKLKISIEGNYVSKIYIAQIIQTGLGSLKAFENIRIFDEYVGQTEPDDLADFIIIKQSLPSESKEEWVSLNVLPERNFECAFLCEGYGNDGVFDYKVFGTYTKEKGFSYGRIKAGDKIKSYTILPSPPTK